MVSKIPTSFLILILGLGMGLSGFSSAAMPTPVNGQITDSVTQTNVNVVGDEPNASRLSKEEQRALARERARALQPMQTLSPPGWQAKPPGWEAAERARLQFIQRQQQLMQQHAQQFGPAHLHWHRHAPAWAQPYFPPGFVPQQLPPLPDMNE